MRFEPDLTKTQQARRKALSTAFRTTADGSQPEMSKPHFEDDRLFFWHPVGGKPKKLDYRLPGAGTAGAASAAMGSDKGAVRSGTAADAAVLEA